MTSIEQGTRTIGYEAAAILNALMLGEESQQRTAIPPEGLVSRQSTDILAINDKDVAAAMQFIKQHACDPIQVKDVLEMANRSRSTIEWRICDLLGRTVHVEIRRVQLENAKRPGKRQAKFAIMPGTSWDRSSSFLMFSGFKPN